MVAKLREARTVRGWSQTRLIYEIERYSQRNGCRIASTPSLRVYVSEWENGRRRISTEYAAILRALLGITNAELFSVENPRDPSNEDLLRSVDTARRIGPGMLKALTSQTELLRSMDREIGAAGMTDQMQAHLARLQHILAFAVLADVRRPVASALAEAASMAGWQALDMGAPERAWRHYELAKAAAHEADNPLHLAHAMGEQAFVLADAGQPRLAVSLVQEARQSGGTRLSPRLISWLYATEAELHALSGHQDACRRNLDRAAATLPDDSETRDPDLPNVFLNDLHLARWRGHALAVLGDDSSIDQLHSALASADRTFVRAQAGLRCDVAQAYLIRGEPDLARAHLAEASLMANRTGSVRHRRRIVRLMALC
jgi:transcriptional regulator with XRE-family HTH domain